jgi:hypothetical protein
MKTVQAKHDYENHCKKYNTLHLYIGTLYEVYLWDFDDYVSFK